MYCNALQYIFRLRPLIFPELFSSFLRGIILLFSKSASKTGPIYTIKSKIPAACVNRSFPESALTKNASSRIDETRNFRISARSNAPSVDFRFLYVLYMCLLWRKMCVFYYGVHFRCSTAFARKCVLCLHYLLAELRVQHNECPQWKVCDDFVFFSLLISELLNHQLVSHLHFFHIFYISDGPGLSHFITKASRTRQAKVMPTIEESDSYLTPYDLNGNGRRGELFVEYKFWISSLLSILFILFISFPQNPRMMFIFWIFDFFSEAGDVRMSDERQRYGTYPLAAHV